MSEKLRLQREQLHRFIGDDGDAVRVFEKLFRGYNDVLDSGRIIESGSNPNGNYVVFSSGLQVCWGEVSNTGTATLLNYNVGTYGWSLYYNATAGITFPKAFAQRPTVSPAFSQAATTNFYVGIRNVSNTTFTGDSYYPNANLYDYAYIAIGEAG